MLGVQQYSACTVQAQHRYRYSTVQYSTTQYSTVCCTTVKYSTVQYSSRALGLMPMRSVIALVAISPNQTPACAAICRLGGMFFINKTRSQTPYSIIQSSTKHDGPQGGGDQYYKICTHTINNMIHTIYPHHLVVFLVGR